MAASILPPMPVTHLLRACLLLVGLISVLPVQVQEAAAFGVGVVRDCPSPCGVKARTVRSDDVRPVLTASVSGQNLPDDGFVPIPATAPTLGAGRAIVPIPSFPVGSETISPARLDRPPKQA